MFSSLRPQVLVLSTALILGACSNDLGDDDAALERRALEDTKSYVEGVLVAFNQSAVALRDAAPVPDADGWNPTQDAAAVASMKSAWKRARVDYERIEGAIAVLFPHLDVATDERYDGFLEEGVDEDLFDAEGVIGIHAVERILWADAHPSEVVAFESSLAGYRAPSFPSNEAEATAFKNDLLSRLVADTETMKFDFGPLALDPATAYRGVIGSMAEQLEKVALGSTGESESRYAQHTLADMRANLDGGRAIYANFKPWLTSKTGGAEIDAEIEIAFGRLIAEYERHHGDGIPAVPATWNPDAPSAADLATSYGQLWSVVNAEADLTVEDSLVSRMTAGADLIGIPVLPE